MGKGNNKGERSDCSGIRSTSKSRAENDSAVEDNAEQSGSNYEATLTAILTATNKHIDDI